jgi:hypothetical protein
MFKLISFLVKNDKYNAVKYVLENKINIYEFLSYIKNIEKNSFDDYNLSIIKSFKKDRFINIVIEESYCKKKLDMIDFIYFISVY